ncbi:MAG TPA: hypothetical protein VHD55_02535 [Candidatus Paceibacterota bacterium]|nr:hypothetical protein [Candidatus Paceibacterota bacterium]
MKILGRGWQYTTYDIGNGRVLKKYNSFLVAYAVMLNACVKSDRLSIFKIPQYHRGCKEFARSSLKKATSGLLDSWMVGNPKPLNELDYEQDKLIPLHERINGISLEKAKGYIDRFVDFNKTLLERGLIDKSFNITKNFGIDSEGRIVLMDLGELHSEKLAIEKQRRKRMWTYPYVVNCILDEEVRAYYVQRMDESFGLAA